MLLTSALSGAMATIRTTPAVCSGRTLAITLKGPLLSEAGALLSLKSNDRTTFEDVVLSATAGIVNIPTLDATKSAAKSTRRMMTTTIAGLSIVMADNVRYVKLERNVQ